MNMKQQYITTTIIEYGDADGCLRGNN
jgi:hypothetical protein